MGYVSDDAVDVRQSGDDDTVHSSLNRRCDSIRRLGGRLCEQISRWMRDDAYNVALIQTFYPNL